MSEQDVYLDVVADGPPPRRDKIEYALMGLLTLLSLWRFSMGEWSNGVTTLLFVALMWIHTTTRRSAWVDGYKSAAMSVKRQVEKTDD